MSETAIILIIVFCLLAEGFFSGSEIAIVSISKIKLNHMAKNGSKAAQLVQNMLKRPTRLLSTTLLGTNVCTVVATALATSLLTTRYIRNADLYATLIMSPLILIFAEIIPKTLYYHYRNKITLILIYPLNVIYFIFYPALFVINGLIRILFKTLNAEDKAQELFVTKEELKSLVKHDKKGETFDKVERELIGRIFEFGDTSVKEILVPLIDVIAVAREATSNQVINLVQQEGFSRFPVFYERVDNIVGIINSFDLIYAKEGEDDITRFIAPAYYVPETMHIDNLLKEFQQKGMQLAVVVDEYGNSQGIVSLEDILEEIVGEIHDEYDDERKLYKKLDEDSYIIDARMELDHIREKLAI